VTGKAATLIYGPQVLCSLQGKLAILTSSISLKLDSNQSKQAEMKQKIVIKVEMTCDKCRSKAMALVAATVRVDSVALAGDGKDQVVVVGDGVDSVKLTSALRKKVGHAQLMQVGEVKKEEEKKTPPNQQPPPTLWSSTRTRGNTISTLPLAPMATRSITQTPAGCSYSIC
jgi:hypothetical protein